MPLFSTRSKCLDRRIRKLEQCRAVEKERGMHPVDILIARERRQCAAEGREYVEPVRHEFDPKCTIAEILQGRLPRTQEPGGRQ
jgi:hypothetical protein